MASRTLGFDLFPAMSINSLRKSPCALKTWHNSLTFSVLDLKSKYLAAIPLFFPKLATETYGMLLSWRTNLMSRRSVYDCFSDSNQNGCHTFTQIQIQTSTNRKHKQMKIQLQLQTNLMCCRSMYYCFYDSNQNGRHHCHTFKQS